MSRSAAVNKTTGLRIVWAIVWFVCGLSVGIFSAYRSAVDRAAVNQAAVRAIAQWCATEFAKPRNQRVDDVDVKELEEVGNSFDLVQYFIEVFRSEMAAEKNKKGPPRMAGE